MAFLSELLVNLLANLVFWLGLGLIVLLYIRIVEFRFLRFFGIQNSRRMIIYLSNLYQPSMGDPDGYIVSGQEFQAVKTVNSLFGSAPFRLPEIVRGLVDGVWIGRRLRVEVKVAPLNKDTIQFGDLLVIGGTPKNSVRRYYLDAGLPCLEIDGEESAPNIDVFTRTLASRVRIRMGARHGDVVDGDYDIAIVEKVRDIEHGTTVIFCTGYRGDCSRAAVEHLALNWRRLHRRYGDDPFALCLGFPKSKRSVEDYVVPVVLGQVADSSARH